MKVLIVGSGGREHAIAWSVSRSPKADKIYCAPGNAGIAEYAECVAIGAMEFEKLAAFAKEKEIDLCIVGDSTIPERYGIIQATKLKAQKQMEELQKQMELLDFKEAFYQNLIKNNLKDTWNPMNNHTPEEAMA